jgi:hypothetical protein
MVVQERPPSLAGRPPPFGHVPGDARLCHFKPELEQLAMNAWSTPKRIIQAHLPDQRAQLCRDLRSPSQWTRLPTPVATKSGPMPTHERFGPDDRDDLEDRREPSIKLDKEPAITVRERGPAPHLASQNDQLMSGKRILRLKPALRPERRNHNGQNETPGPDHPASLGDSIPSATRIRFSVHTGSRSAKT